MFVFDPNHPLRQPDTRNAIKKTKQARASTTIEELEKLCKDATAGSLYLTIKALDDDVYGRIKLNTDITTEDIQKYFNKDDGKDIGEKLDELRDKHGIRSGIMQ